ncbi:MAG: LysR substrate-binding domain-containing protein [Kiloniellaceae bacterium]
MNFVQMRAFNAVVRYGSISAAAQQLGVSKPAITQQIRALEDSLGIRLFHRKGNSLAISASGRRFLEPAQVMARVLDEIEVLAARTAGNDEGALRIGACAPFVLVPILAAFAQRYPGIRSCTEMGNSQTLAAKVQNHELDVAIATLRRPPPEFHSICLVTQSVRAVVAAAHPWARRRRVTLADLAGQVCVMRERGSMTRSLIEDAAAAVGVTLDARLELGSREAVKEAVAAGFGVGFVLDREIGRDSALVEVEIAGTGLSAGEYLYCHKDLAGIGAIKAFIDVASAVCGIGAAPAVVA